MTLSKSLKERKGTLVVRVSKAIVQVGGVMKTSENDPLAVVKCDQDLKIMIQRKRTKSRTKKKRTGPAPQKLFCLLIKYETCRIN